jgi:uncharacterized protein
MSSKMFVNLPVRNLKQSMSFFKALGYSFNQQFSDDTGACMVISEENYAMLLTESKMRQFTPRPIADAAKSTEVIIALSCESREQVRRLVSAALTQGGSRVGEPKDFGFMFQDGFQDLDGHIWEFFWMDPSHVQQDEK